MGRAGITCHLLVANAVRMRYNAGAMSLAVIDNVTKRFGADLIFAGASFRIESNERIGLVGPNGAGKSTLLNLLARRYTPDEGQIAFVRGTRVGYLPQIPDFAPERTLREEL